MRFDIHTHCKWSKESRLNKLYLQDMFTHAKQQLDAIAITEHFNSNDFSQIFDWLMNNGSYQNGHFRYEGLIIWPGIEVDVAEGAHIVVIGELDAIHIIDQLLEPYRNSGHYIPLPSLLNVAMKLDCICIGAHPYREENPLYVVDSHLISQLDALDMNGRDLYHYGLAMEQRVLALAKQYNLPVVGGSDTHHYEQYGVIVNETACSIEHPSELKQLLREGKYSYLISEKLQEQVEVAEKEQRTIKQLGRYI